jgi:hypothetical protein
MSMCLAMIVSECVDPFLIVVAKRVNSRCCESANPVMDNGAERIDVFVLSEFMSIV